MPVSLTLCLQICSGSADGPSHFMNEQIIEVNSCLKCVMPNAIVEKVLQFMQFCIYQTSNTPLIHLLFPCVPFSQ